MRAIVEVFDRSDMAELEYEDKDISLKLARYPTPSRFVGEPLPARPALATAPSPAAASGPAPAPPQVSERPADTHILKSPFVGTFYRAPSPEAPNFTDVGQRVSTGQTVCIIEAMKLMNEIPADVDGRIVAVRVDNGEPVQFGDPLFEISVN